MSKDNKIIPFPGMVGVPKVKDPPTVMDPRIAFESAAKDEIIYILLAEVKSPEWVYKIAKETRGDGIILFDRYVKEQEETE